MSEPGLCLGRWGRLGRGGRWAAVGRRVPAWHPSPGLVGGLGRACLGLCGGPGRLADGPLLAPVRVLSGPLLGLRLALGLVGVQLGRRMCQLWVLDSDRLRPAVTVVIQRKPRLRAIRS